MTLVRKDWNVLASVSDGAFECAKWTLGQFGIPGETGDRNLLVVTVADVDRFLRDMKRLYRSDETMAAKFNWIRPARRKVRFEDDRGFRAKVTGMLTAYAPRLVGKHYCLRLTDWAGAGLTVDERELREELYEAMTEELEGRAEEATIAESGCELVIDVETIDGTAGVSVWSADEIRRYPFLAFGATTGRPVSSDARSRSSRPSRR